MAIKWTAERNERLLLLVIRDLKVEANRVAKEWAEKYGHDDFKPTPRAISEQFSTLKKKAGGKGGAGKVTSGVSTPKTPRTTAKSTPSGKNTPTTNGKATLATPSKRKKGSAAPGDDDSDPEDDDSELDLKNLPRAISRASIAREKKKPKRYEESDTDAESEMGKADDERDDLPLSSFKVNGAGGVVGGGVGEQIHVAVSRSKGIDSVMGDLTAKAKNKAGSKANTGWFEDDSDVSDFAKSSL